MLIVDDKASVRTMLVEVFRDQGFDIREAGSGEEAIALIAKEPFQIVISDLSMPNKNGIDVLRAAKSASQETEVIIATGYGTIETAVEAMRLGAHDFITKPINISELERKVEKIVRKIERIGQGTMQTWIHPGIQHMVGASPQTKELMKMILRRRTLQELRTHHRAQRRRKGTRRTRNTRSQSTSRQALHRRKLRSTRTRYTRKRTLRSRSRCLYRCQ